MIGIDLKFPVPLLFCPVDSAKIMEVIGQVAAGGMPSLVLAMGADYGDTPGARASYKNVPVAVILSPELFSRMELRQEEKK